MQDLEGVNRSKEKILSTLRMKGPCLPVQIAKEINFSPLFASAFLSELKAEGKVSISNLRVGSSPLYFLPGQENMLEKFSGYLNQREKEAFALLKEKQFLEDREQSPILRVALRAIKDFAQSVKVRIGDESKLFWKYFTLSEEDVISMVKSGMKRALVPVKPKVEESKIEPKKEEISSEVHSEVSSRFIEDERPLAEKKKQKVQESEFVINVKDFLRAKDIEILEVIAERKKDFEARVGIDTLLGKQEFYLVAKDKKSVNDNDFAVALQKGQSKKMPAALMSTGDLSKKGKEHLESWGNLVKFEKLKF
jgi:hypothetical protein